jgi:dienelactone hydrolase
MRQSPSATARLLSAFLFAGAVASASAETPAPDYRTVGPPLAGTRALDAPGDLASRMVDGADRFLQQKLDESKANRAARWARDHSSAEAYAKSIEPQRLRLAHILGVRDPLDTSTPIEVIQSADRASYDGDGLTIRSVRWTAFGDVTGEGLELRPVGDAKPVAAAVVIPDADGSPEQLAGIAPGLPPERQVARRLAESGLRVIVPVLIDRAVAPRMGGATMTSREFLHRPAFVMGRTLIGYEVQKVLAAVDRLAADGARVGVYGHGEGGGVALYAAALDPRIAACGVSGYFDDRDDVWRQPLDRNVFGLLERFGDAEIASMIAPRPLIVEAARGPEFTFAPGQGGAPGRLQTPSLETVRAEVDRAAKLVEGLGATAEPALVVSGDDGRGPSGSEPALSGFLSALGATLAPAGPALQAPALSAEAVSARQARQLHEIDRHTQRLLLEGPAVRREFMKGLDTSSLAAYEKSVEPYRERFATEIIGRFDDEFLPLDVRSRQIFDEPTFAGYEVVIDVFPDVFAAGILLMPKGIKEGERRPVVVCQHGLEGRPSNLADPNVENPSYHRFAVRLAESGFITFSPQNPYIFEDRFRTLQRKANPLGKTLFSLIVPQHRRITDWLKTLDQVDPDRIGFYGLSYGGKSAMRIPPLVDAYRLSICSADFNDWVWKNVSTSSPYSYVRTGEYEIFEFDLGNTFNYSEMAALIAPRPFMVERGHFDTVAPDEAVAYEFAKVFFLYDARLKIGDRCANEFFNGPHTINAQGTFRFLREHLNWPEPK